MTRCNQIPYLNEAELSDLDISTNEIIEKIEALITCAEQHSAWSAPKSVILPGDGRYMMSALAAADDPPLLTVKTALFGPGNSERGLPPINGLVTMLDSTSGLPVAILDGNWITAVRTAGLSATAAKHMANKDATVIAFVGCGVQARSHLQAFVDIFPLKEARIFGRGQSNIDRLCEAASDLNLSTVVSGNAEEAVSGADLIVISVSFSSTADPFLDANSLKSGSFSAIADMAVPWKKETFRAFDQVTIDDLMQEATLTEKLSPPEFVTGDLSGLVLGRFSGRNKRSDRNAFIFRGHAMGDLALSMLAYKKALQRNS